ncbi:MAG: cob(I)alamin adenolsyltransferase/cobinamide ATP-dependent adenolsyltransferase [Candidatus Sumerlaea sp.]|uniref:Cob(I)alamin adenosyltransferase n=1 Tax=Sumerlaea chitinivorans TaxID=2250252 RepID=A0A2Z4Y8Q8_SUMC1|nr:Cob(I)alamin adenosyltransferase [Candidatus Sumerlaea chitinivorans]GIX43880.1 MAG: cob(I)alamin adenolsyltransferase/cobinamide ATP-dependent adenolsyltransferase [Candidatus Sumerlaea sp.]
MGFLHVYTGEGKGKTTSAVGLAIRAAGAGERVAFLQFDKGFEGRNEHYHERAILRTIPNIDLFFFGQERMMPDGRFRFANEPGDFEEAQRALAKAREIIESERYFLVVCDEAITCVQTRLLTEDDVMELTEVFRAHPTCDLVLTGRGAFPRLIEAADLVSNVQLVKHYFYQGVPARRGIEF